MFARMMQKREALTPANDNPAKAANDGRASGEPLAGLAALAFANPTEPKTAKPAKVGADDTVAAPMTADEDAVIRAWLALIEETDPATIAEVIDQCQRDADARDYFTGRAAAEPPKPGAFPDDRRTCTQCVNLRQRACAIAKPERGALVVANQGYRPDPARLVRCDGYAPLASDPDQRPGAERWPGLFQKGGD
jgi:hypothetical protein